MANKPTSALLLLASTLLHTATAADTPACQAAQRNFGSMVLLNNVAVDSSQQLADLDAINTINDFVARTKACPNLILQLAPSNRRPDSQQAVNAITAYLSQQGETITPRQTPDPILSENPLAESSITLRLLPTAVSIQPAPIVATVTPATPQISTPAAPEILPESTPWQPVTVASVNAANTIEQDTAPATPTASLSTPWQPVTIATPPATPITAPIATPVQPVVEAPVIPNPIIPAPIIPASQPPATKTVRNPGRPPKPQLPIASSPPCGDAPPADPNQRRRPGRAVLRYNEIICNPNAPVAADTGILKPSVPVPDRWRIMSSLGYDENLIDPYNNNNVLKGDRPMTAGSDWFFNVIGISDTIIEPRSFPLPVGNATSDRPGSLDTIGHYDQVLFAQSFITELVLYKGDTVFRPPDYEFRLTPVFQYNVFDTDERVIVRTTPRSGTIRRDNHVGFQAAFVDYHIRNVSTRYDFDSIRVGIQPFSSDFRGFLFQDQQLGVRLFGTRNNNIFQYNLAWFRRLEKDTNSGLNDIGVSPREDDIYIANLYWQDFPKLGFFSQVTVAHNSNREGNNEPFFDNNSFIARPASLGLERSREYEVSYLGYNGDGHFGRLNLTVSAYYAYGRESNGTFVDEPTDIRAFFMAAEAGIDMDWVRLRFSGIYGSGDDDPYDTRAEGFDAIFENPQIAGSDTSYWIRQTVPLIGGGRVAISSRNGVLNNLRSSKEQGQSNFTNPGVILLGFGADLDLTPTFRLSFNANHLWFDSTATIEAARNQGPVEEDIGFDLSIATIYRPFATQNIVARFSGAVLLPGDGFKNLYGDNPAYSFLANIVLMY